jgi:YVTN family beta-propeller protein
MKPSPLCVRVDTPVRSAALRRDTLTVRLVRAMACLLALASLATFASAAGLKAYVGNFKDNTVSVIDTAAGAVVATVPVGAGPDGIAITPDGKTVFVSGASASTVAVIDATTDKVVQTIEIGKGPQGLAMTADGRILLVAVNGDDRVAIVDTSTRAIIGTVAVTKPHTIAIRADGKQAYVSSQEPGHFALVAFDLATRAVVATVPLDKPPRDLEFGYDGKALYFTLAGVAAVQVLDPQANKVVQEIPTGASPHIANYFAGTSAGVVVVQGPGELLLFDPATNKAIRSIAVGKQPHWVDAADGGKKMYVTNEGSNDVTVIDLSNDRTTTIAVGNAPRKIAVQRAGAKMAAGAQVSIANFAFAPARISISPGQSVRWTNDDGAPHGLAFKDGAPGADLMLPGASFSRTYDKPGTYDYICAVHAYMTGQVIVRAE